MRLVLLFCGLLLLTPTAYAEDDEETVVPEVIYHALNPQFTVNLLGNKHYLRTTIQLQLADQKTKNAIEANDPAIRHALIVVLSNNQVDDISNADGLNALRLKAVDSLNKTLKKHAKIEGVTDVFFTDFVSQ
jgi:flagellar protein FliL|tara:strand:+ start:863 stop:1258 length:396 start_codon:yes stop_codon:yes gene_type:complete